MLVVRSRVGVEKVFERKFVQDMFLVSPSDWAREEVVLKTNQYDGEPGSGSTHLLVELLDTMRTTGLRWS